MTDEFETSPARQPTVSESTDEALLWARERARKREALRELTKLTEEFGGYEELKGDNEETAR